MAVDKEYITDMSSTFSGVDASRIDRLVERLGFQVPASKWGIRRDMGLAYLVMHTIALGDFQAGKGAVIKQRLRDVERQFSSVTGKGDSEYQLTFWGQEFLRLRRQLLAGPRVTGGC